MESSEDRAKAAREFLAERARRRGGLVPWMDKSAERRRRLRGGLFDRQLAFIDDPAKKKAAHPGRRGGKTFCIAAYQIDAALSRPESPCLYLAITRKSAKILFWPELKRMNQRYDLGMEFNNSDLIATLDNGSYIQLGGADNASEIDKYRGNKYLIAGVDESASFGEHLDSLEKEVLEPAMFDLDGTLFMVGTPAAHCTGAFFEATTSSNSPYSVHHWTMLDNPHIPNADDKLEQLKKDRGWDDDNPIFLREYMGRWVRSDDSLVYRFDPGRNTYTSLPDQHLEYVLGVDLGFDDPATFVVWAFTPDRPETFLVHAEKHVGMIPSEAAERIHDLMTGSFLTDVNLRTQFRGFNKIRADTGGLGKAIVEEWRKRHGLPVMPAEKDKKNEWIELMNDDLRTSKIKVPTDCPVIAEWQVIQWDDKRKFEDDRFPNDLADAALYGWRECYHWTHKARPAEPEFGSRKYWDREADMLEQQAIDALAQPERPFWDDEEV